jgi:hypothetical protein
MSFFSEHLQASPARVPNMEVCTRPLLPCSRGDSLACWMTLLCVIDIQKNPRAVSLPRQNNYPQVKQTNFQADFVTTFVFANQTIRSLQTHLALRHLL